MKILFVASRFPWPITHGDCLRAYHQLRLLSSRHQITLLSPEPRADIEENLWCVEPFCERIELISTPLWKRWWRLTQALFTTLPLQTLYTCDPQMRRQVEWLLQEKEEEPFDLIHVQLMRMAPAAVGVRDVPTVIDFIDALSLNMKRRAEREAWYKRWLFTLEARRAQAYEQRLLSRYTRAIVSTQIDHEALGSHRRIQVAANGVDPDCTFVGEGRRSNVVAFTGHISYFPNADAAIWFVTQVLPLVRRQRPDTQFWIIGANPPPAVRTLTQQPGVVVTGYVPSIAHYLQQATLAVAPMQCGSGMQLKVLEAMACGAPIVVTPFALGGLEVRQGEHLMIGRDATEFSDLVLQLLQDAGLRRKLAVNARRLVDERYGWERSVAHLEATDAQAVRSEQGSLTRKLQVACGQR